MGIADLMNERRDFLNSHYLFEPVQPTINDIVLSSERVIPNSEITISCTVTDANRVIFAHRNNIFDGYLKVEMNNMGNPGISKTSIYDLPLSIGAGEIQYFIYAENENAVTFSPENAEYGYNILPVSGDLVINEFLASNNTSITDEEGEYDDYIELYNNSDNSIRLKNYYLSDKSDNLTKWKFPDVEIDTNDYLIIWADEDSLQSGLHANFKLSSSGEELFLLNSDKVIIDRVSFGVQSSDVSFGRYPNGTGVFKNMLPTFAEENKDISAPTKPSQYDGYILEQNYPNPFNPNTIISYTIPESGSVNLSVYNILGQSVSVLVEQFITSGSYQVGFDGSALSSGIYFYRLSAGDYVNTKKMLLIK